LAALLLALAAILTPLAASFAAEPEGLQGPSLFSEVGCLIGAGSGNLPEGHYQPSLFILHLAVDLQRYFPPLEKHPGRLTAFAEPQFNAAARPKANLECGIGFGLRYTYPLTERLSAYLLGSVGPHYITVVTQKQANGFVWADSLGAGLFVHLTKGSAINIGYRFRHLSNAEMALPNGGINTHMVLVGYSLFFP
jgi:hypothetical protein